MQRVPLSNIIHLQESVTFLANHKPPKDPSLILLPVVVNSYCSELAPHLEYIIDCAPKLALKMTAHKATSFLQKTKNGILIEYKNYKRYGIELASIFRHERFSISVYAIDATRNEFSSRELLPESTRLRFPVAAAELSEAAMCFTLYRNTACVFHAVRSLESPLRLIAKSLKIPTLSNMQGRNWHALLTEIEKALANQPKAKKEALQHTLSYLSNVRGPLRNSTMHLEKNYNAEEAKDILDTVIMFFKYLPLSLKEKPTTKATSRT